MKKKYYEKYLCTSEKSSKVVNISICDSDLLSMEYRKLWESKGFEVSCFKIPCDIPHGVACEDNVSATTHSFRPANGRKKLYVSRRGKCIRQLKSV